MRGASRAAMLCAFALAGCAQPASYATQLDTQGGLGPGDPVTHASATIGHVTAVSPLDRGDVQAEFEVDGPHTAEIHQDSIMILNDLGAAPSLDVMNVDAMSPAAAPGTRLDGASSMNEAQLYIIARGPGSYAQALQHVVGGNTPPPPSPAVLQMQQMMAQISQQTLAAAAATSPATRYQMNQAAREAAGVERQLLRNGKSEQAERLRATVGGTMPGLSAPANPLALPPSPPTP